jgi:hypothetical protein
MSHPPANHGMPSIDLSQRDSNVTKDDSVNGLLIESYLARFDLSYNSSYSGRTKEGYRKKVKSENENKYTSSKY